MTRICLLATLLLGCASAAFADDPEVYALSGRRDGIQRYQAQLEVEDLGNKRVRLRWSEPDRGVDMEAEGERIGGVVRVRFPAPTGARGRLVAGQGGTVLGIYQFVEDRVSGVLIEGDGALPWRIAVERGLRAAAPSGFSPAGKLAFKRVVLCVDGIPHQVLSELIAQGRFKGFKTPARMVTVFPSLSAISWGRLFGLPSDVGYQVEYYSNHLGKVMGATKKQMLTQTVRAEARMHYRHHGLIGHALAYVFPFRVGRKQVRKLIHELREHEGSRTAFVYAYQTDAIAHMMGREKLVAVLGDIEQELTSLQEWFRKEKGEELEVVLVSDHGHTMVSGELVEINDHLERRGWKLVEEVRKPRQVNFSSAGILSSIALHCQEAGEPELAGIVAELEGVDLCTYDVDGKQQFVVSSRGVARFDYHAKSDRYAYSVLSGSDPIGYQAIYLELAREGKLDGKRRALSRDLFARTMTHKYPDAAHRIRLGHKPGELVQNPANVLVSLAKGYENARGIVKKIAAISPSGRSGTHGALTQDDSVGVFASNFMQPFPGMRPEDLERVIDLADYRANRPPLEVVTAPGPDGGTLLVEAKVPAGSEGSMGQSAAEVDERTTVRITVRRKRFLLRDPVVWKETFKANELQRSQDAYQIPAKILSKLKSGKSYRVETKVESRDAAGKVVESRKNEVELDYRGAHQIYD